jgi:hypothetical protein
VSNYLFLSANDEKGLCDNNDANIDVCVALIYSSSVLSYCVTGCGNRRRRRGLSAAFGGSSRS